MHMPDRTWTCLLICLLEKFLVPVLNLKFVCPIHWLGTADWKSLMLAEFRTNSILWGSSNSGPESSECQPLSASSRRERTRVISVRLYRHECRAISMDAKPASVTSGFASAIFARFFDQRRLEQPLATRCRTAESGIFHSRNWGKNHGCMCLIWPERHWGWECCDFDVLCLMGHNKSAWISSA